MTIKELITTLIIMAAAILGVTVGLMLANPANDWHKAQRDCQGVVEPTFIDDQLRFLCVGGGE